MKKIICIFLVFGLILSLQVYSFADNKEKKLTFWGIDFGTEYTDVMRKVNNEFEKSKISTGQVLRFSDEEQYQEYIEVDDKIKITKEFNAETIDFVFVMGELMNLDEDSLILASGKYYIRKQSEANRDKIINLLLSMYGEPDKEEREEKYEKTVYTWTGFEDDCELIVSISDKSGDIVLEYLSNVILEKGMENYKATVELVNAYEENYNMF